MDANHSTTQNKGTITNLPDDIREKLAADPDEVRRNLMTLDSTFRFECRGCGGCCKNQETILLTARDLFRIARKRNKTMDGVIKECAEVYIGSDSRLPVVHMLPKGPKRACVYLTPGGKCSVHDSKPAVCALYPLGRVLMYGEAKSEGTDGSEMADAGGRGKPECEETVESGDSEEVGYILNQTTCGSYKHKHTVRSWLAHSGIKERDEFFLKWSRMIARLSLTAVEVEKNIEPQAMKLFWNVLLNLMYLNYDTEGDFDTQFHKNMDELERVRWMMEKAFVKGRQARMPQ